MASAWNWNTYEIVWNLKCIPLRLENSLECMCVCSFFSLTNNFNSNWNVYSNMYVVISVSIIFSSLEKNAKLHSFKIHLKSQLKMKFFSSIQFPRSWWTIYIGKEKYVEKSIQLKADETVPNHICKSHESGNRKTEINIHTQREKEMGYCSIKSGCCCCHLNSSNKGVQKEANIQSIQQ